MWTWVLLRSLRFCGGGSSSEAIPGMALACLLADPIELFFDLTTRRLI
jgi:ABC-type Mn2+/Zn2+ transport system permease subunit